DPHHLGRMLRGAHMDRRAGSHGRRGHDGARAAAPWGLAVVARTVGARRECDPPSSPLVRKQIPIRNHPGDDDVEGTDAVMILTLARSLPADVASLAPARSALDQGRIEIWEVSVKFRSGARTVQGLEKTSVVISPGSLRCQSVPMGSGNGN